MLRSTRAFSSLLVIVLLLTLSTVPVAGQDGAKVSRLGQYAGYSTPEYRDWVRTSEYVAARDGTRLALDVVRPAVDGKPVDEKLPVLLIYERYQRADFVNGKPVSQARFVQFWSYWLSYGYVIATADMRGAGASFGSRVGELIDFDSTDAYDVIEWLAAQPWSNGKVGMMGVSAQGISQLLAAGSAPPALRAIVPQMAMFDLYSFAYPGGVFRYEFLKAWAANLYRLDNLTPPVPVDADTDGALAKAAVKEHAANIGVYETSQHVPYRDNTFIPPNLPSLQPYLDLSPTRFIDGMNKSNAAVYLIGGWYDMWPRDAVAWFNNLTVPRRVILTPFSHGSGFDAGWYQFSKQVIHDDFSPLVTFSFQVTEHLRFFDYHLKGIDNGIMDEAAVWYYVMGAPAGQAWRSATQWPLPEEQRTRYYLTNGPDPESTVDNGLVTEQPGLAGKDAYTVDYTTTTGDNTRWHNGHGVRFYYDDMAAQDQKSLTYTTGPLTQSIEVTGHPTVSLWASSDAKDGDFFVYLEEVDEKGHSTYITEGVLRASHRKLSEPPFKYMNLPWHRSYAEDIAPLTPGEPAELVFDLHPTSNSFDAGHRIRVRIAGADTGSYLTPQIDPPPVVQVYYVEPASYVELPIIPAK